MSIIVKTRAALATPRLDLATRIRRWIVRHRTAAALRKLDRRLLNDIGLVPGDIDRVAAAVADEHYAPAHRPAITAEPRREIAEKPALTHPAGVTGFVLSVDKVMRGGFRNATGGDHRAKAA